MGYRLRRGPWLFPLTSGLTKSEDAQDEHHDDDEADDVDDVVHGSALAPSGSRDPVKTERTTRGAFPSSGAPFPATLPNGKKLNILAWIVAGIIAGWLAERITGRSHGLLTNLFVGIIGAFLGGFIFSGLLGFRDEEGVDVASIVVATVGAVVLLAIFGGFRSAPDPERAQRRYLFAAVGIPSSRSERREDDVWQLQDHAGWAVS